MKEYPNISKAIITRPGDVEWAYASEARQMLPHLRLLAEAVLEAHKADALTDLEGNGNWVHERIGCQCEVCKVAREYTNGLV